MALVGSAAWKEALEQSNPTIAVMLAGGGAPTKDLVKIPGSERVKVQPLYGDALNLQGCHSTFHPNGASILRSLAGRSAI